MIELDNMDGASMPGQAIALHVCMRQDFNGITAVNACAESYRHFRDGVHECARETLTSYSRLWVQHRQVHGRTTEEVCCSGLVLIHYVC